MAQNRAVSPLNSAAFLPIKGPVYCAQPIEKLLLRQPLPLNILQKVRSGQKLSPARPDILRREIYLVLTATKESQIFVLNLVMCDVYRTKEEKYQVLASLLWSRLTNSLECRETLMNKPLILETIRGCFKEPPEIWS